MLRGCFILGAPALHHLLDTFCKLGGGPQSFDEDGAAFQEEVLCRRGELCEVSGHGGVLGDEGRAGQLPPDIIYGEPHRHHAGLIPGALLALYQGSSLIQNIAHYSPCFKKWQLIGDLPLSVLKGTVTFNLELLCQSVKNPF